MAHLAVRVIGGLVAGLAVLAALFAWRLASGPISLDLLAPHIAAALAGNGISVTIDHTLLSFSQGPRFQLVARGLHLRRQNGGATLTLPEVRLGLSARAALHGMIAPTRVVVKAPFLEVERDPSGAFHLGLGDAAASASQDWGAVLLHDLAGPPNGQGPLGYLTDVAVRDAALTVNDRSLGLSWHADHADVVLHRRASGMTGDIRFTVGPGDRQAAFSGTLDYRRATASLAVALRFSGLRPAAWSSAAPALAPLAAIDLPTSGEVRAVLDTRQFTIRSASCDLVLGTGSLRHAGLVGGAVAVAGGTLAATYDPAAGRLDLDRITLDLGGPQLSATGTVDGLGGNLLAGAWPRSLDAALTVEAQNLPVDDFSRLWPERLAVDTRAWVTEHVHDGTVDSARMQLGLHADLPAASAASVSVDRLSGTLDYRNLTVAYFNPLPPVRGVDGKAAFDLAHIDFTPTAGHLAGVKVSGGDVRLYKLDTDDQQAAIDLKLAGPLRDALETLDAKPLGYARDLGINPAQVAGSFDAHVHFAFPLVHDLRFDQVAFGAEATLDKLAVAKALFERDLSAGALKMRLDRSALRLDGSAQLAGVPITLSWTESFKPADGVHTRYRVGARLDEAARQRLGLDLFPDVVSGTVDADLAYAVKAHHRAQATVMLDLKDADLAVARLGWHKPQGTPARAKAELQLANDHVTALSDAVLEGGGMNAHVAARFDPKLSDAGGLAKLDVKRLVVGGTDVTGTVARRAGGGWRVQLSGASFDAAPLIAEITRRSPDEPLQPPLVIDAQLDRLILGPQREARAVRGQLFSDGVHWQAASVDANMMGGGKLRLRFGVVGGERSLDLTTTDFGALLRLFDISGNIQGGQLQLTGKVRDEGARRLMAGHIEGSDYRLVGAPLFARLLSVASLSGIGALLSGQGIPFTHLTSDFVYSDGKITADNLRAYGGAIGVNASGTLDYGGDTLDVSGTLVPAYTLNTVLGNIPVLGDLLLGGKGEGIFAANFRVAGALDDPKISVNPLSTLAPGFLRKLFLFEAPNPMPQKTPAPEGASRGG